MAQLGRFELVGRLAAGGIGEVWIARERTSSGLERVVALKRLRSALACDPSNVAVFVEEARLTARLDHRNIVRVHAHEVVDGEDVIIMELVFGESLRVLQRRTWELRGAPVPPALGARIVAEACRGLHHAHTAVDSSGATLAVVHRDVSPSNILVTYRGEVKVVDFGIARALGGPAAGGGGKVAYLSPERCVGTGGGRDPVGARSDVFAAGVVLWELVTGVRLFGGMGEVETRAAIGAPEPVRSAAAARAGLDPALVDVVARALVKDPAGRFVSAAALADELEAWLVRCAEPSDPTALGAFVEDLCRDRRERLEDLLSRRSSS